MPGEVKPDRVAAIAAAARIPLAPDDAERIVRAVTPTATRFAAAKIDLPLETEPASFVVVQRREIGR
jgi:seryl-tRNA(Sec) selenium transferase